MITRVARYVNQLSSRYAIRPPLCSPGPKYIPELTTRRLVFHHFSSSAVALCAPGPTFLGSKDSSPFRIRSPCSLVSGCEITIKECQCEKDRKNVIIRKECRAPYVGPSLGSPTNVSKVRMGRFDSDRRSRGPTTCLRVSYPHYMVTRGRGRYSVLEDVLPL